MAAIDKDKHYLSETDKVLFEQVVSEKYKLSDAEQLAQRQANIANLEAATAKRKNQLSSIETELKKKLPEAKAMEMLIIVKNNNLEEDLLPILQAKNFNANSTIPFLMEVNRNPNSLGEKRAELKILREDLRNNPTETYGLIKSKSDKPKANASTPDLKPEFANAENFIKPYIKGNSPANQEQRRNLLLNLQNTGTAGQKMLAHIKSGKFDKIEGYDELILSASKKPSANDNGYSHELVAANQALDAADKYLKTYPPERIRFEHKGGADFDIDLGIKNADNSQLYDEAMQCKAWRSSIKDTRIKDACSSLLNVPSHQNTKKIVEIICHESTTLEELTQAIPMFKKHGKPNGINEFRVKLYNGQKYIIKGEFDNLIPDEN